MHQLHKYGYFLDSIQRTNKDLNDYKIEGCITTFNIYNQKNQKVGEFIIDTEDINKVKYHKWRINHNHVVTGTKHKNNVKDLSWIILDIEDIKDTVVDHINHNPFDNRKCNLRQCKQSENTKNVSLKENNTSGYVGVYYLSNRNKWAAEIKVNYKKIHLGEYKSKEDAIYARMIAEALYFDEYKNESEFQKKYEKTLAISAKKRKEICKKITDKYVKFNTQSISVT